MLLLFGCSVVGFLMCLAFSLAVWRGKSCGVWGFSCMFFLFLSRFECLSSCFIVIFQDFMFQLYKSLVGLFCESLLKVQVMYLSS